MSEQSARPRVKPLVAESVLDLIGNTPLVRIRRLAGDGMASVYGKMEGMNPGGSVKDRIALSMICDGENKGLLHKDSVVIEPTSGNTGIGLALVCAVKGYRLILTMPDTMSVERRQLLKRYGAELVLTPGSEGMKGAVDKAFEIAEKIPHSFVPQQFVNPANPRIHSETTAEEIWEALGGKIDAFVAGVGTGGTITGCGEVFKKRRPGIRIIAVEPEKSPVLSGGEPGAHKIQGIGAGFVPEVYNHQVVDEVVKVREEDAWRMTKRLALEEGLLSGISTGAIFHAALHAARRLGAGKNVVAVICDTGERYLSLEDDVFLT